MDRRAFALVVTLGVLAAPLSAQAQGPSAPRIGLLTAQSRVNPAFFRCLADLGLVEGKTLVIEHRYAQGKVERLPELAADLVRLGVEAIVAMSNEEIEAARRATPSIPIVMIFGAAPDEVGFIKSYARPGGNVTGMSWTAPEAAGKTVEFVRAVLPRGRRLAWLWGPLYPGMALMSKSVERAAQDLGFALQSLEMRRAEDFEPAFRAIRSARAEAVIVAGDSLTWAHSRSILAFAAKAGLPTVHNTRWQVEQGGLMSYGPNYVDQFCRAAGAVDRILKGANPADLPVEQPTKFELVINLKTAKALGLTISQSLLLRADQLIE